MIILSFFDVSNQKSVISKKNNFVSTEYPQIGIDLTYLGVKMNEKVSFLEIADF